VIYRNDNTVFVLLLWTTFMVPWSMLCLNWP